MLTGGTDVHLILVDLRESELSGQDAEDRLHEIRITVNRNAVPFDPRPPRVTSGLRIGSPALTTRGLRRDDFLEIGEIIGAALGPQFEARRSELLERVGAIVERYPLYADLASRRPHTDLLIDRVGHPSRRATRAGSRRWLAVLARRAPAGPRRPRGLAAASARDHLAARRHA